jgi:hypothetical protein
MKKPEVKNLATLSLQRRGEFVFLHRKAGLL